MGAFLLVVVSACLFQIGQFQGMPSNCGSSPCLNGGTCLNLGGTAFSCMCTQNHTGAICETLIQADVPIPTNCPDPTVCKNGATCVYHADGGGTECICTAGFDGEFCDKAVAPAVCDSVTCNNGGTCEAEVCTPKAVCKCHKDYTGPFCSKRKLNNLSRWPFTCTFNGKDVVGGHHAALHHTHYTNGPNGFPSTGLYFVGAETSFAMVDNLPPDYPLQLNNQFTFCAQIRPVQPGPIFVYKGSEDDGTKGWALVLKTTMKVMFSTSTFSATSANILKKNKWNKFCIHYRTNDIKFFIDGEIKNHEDTVTRMKFTNETDKNAIYMGSYPGSEKHFQGSVYCARIYKTALKIAEMQADPDPCAGHAQQADASVTTGILVNQYVKGGRVSKKIKTLEKCQSACQWNHHCIAYDYHLGNNECRLHYGKSGCEDPSPRENSLHVRVRGCTCMHAPPVMAADVYTSTSMWKLTKKPADAADLLACISLCKNNTNCAVVDFDEKEKKCHQYGEGRACEKTMHRHNFVQVSLTTKCDPCNKDRCNPKGGVCLRYCDIPRAVACHCHKTHFGFTCAKEHKVTTCDKFKCANGGTCVDGWCKCQSGYLGRTCKRAKCTDKVCNGGTCKRVNKKIQCTCPDDKTGNYCEKKKSDKDATDKDGD